MDFVMFYSQFSTPCKQILEQFPALKSYGFRVDSTKSRRIASQLGILSVPTLAVGDGQRFIQRVVGSTSIEAWLTAGTQQLNLAYSNPMLEEQQQEQSEIYYPVDDEQEQYRPPSPPPPVSVSDVPDIDTSMLKSSKQSAKQIAEELQRERDREMSQLAK